MYLGEGAAYVADQLVVLVGGIGGGPAHRAGEGGGHAFGFCLLLACVVGVGWGGWVGWGWGWMCGEVSFRGRREEEARPRGTWTGQGLFPRKKGAGCSGVPLSLPVGWVWGGRWRGGGGGGKGLQSLMKPPLRFRGALIGQASGCCCVCALSVCLRKEARLRVAACGWGCPGVGEGMGGGRRGVFRARRTSSVHRIAQFHGGTLFSVWDSPTPTTTPLPSNPPPPSLAPHKIPEKARRGPATRDHPTHPPPTQKATPLQKTLFFGTPIPQLTHPPTHTHTHTHTHHPADQSSHVLYDATPNRPPPGRDRYQPGQGPAHQ